MSDAEYLNVSLVAASLLDGLDNLGVVVLNVPVLDADLLDLARVIDQVSKFVWIVSDLVLTGFSGRLDLD